MQVVTWYSQVVTSYVLRTALNKNTATLPAGEEGDSAYCLPYAFEMTYIFVIVERAAVMLTVRIQFASIGNANLTLAHRTN